MNYGPSSDDGLSGKNVETMADVFFRASQRYLGQRLDKNPSNLWVLFVIDDGERNICD